LHKLGHFHPAKTWRCCTGFECHRAYGSKRSYP
jgi:hypothetical protein